MLDYLKSHNDGSADRLIEALVYECSYADCDTFSICPDDLDCISESAERKLRKRLNKAANDPWTLEDCEAAANALADHICEEFSENLHNAIEYDL